MAAADRRPDAARPRDAAPSARRAVALADARRDGRRASSPRPAAFVWFHVHEGLALRYALLLTLFEVAAFRGLVDLLFRRFIASPSLFGQERVRAPRARTSSRAAEPPSGGSVWRIVRFGLVVADHAPLAASSSSSGAGSTWGETAHGIWHTLSFAANPNVLGTLIMLPLFFLVELPDLLGPDARHGHLADPRLPAR